MGPSTATAPRRILVVEDDPNLADVLERYLVKDGYSVEVQHSGDGGLHRALEWLPDLVVLDVMLPGMDGLEVCQRIRRSAPIPVVMLTARATEDDRVLGLELGADDYVTKPFSPRELTARVGAVLRRATGPLAPAQQAVATLRAGAVALDPIAREALLDDAPLHLTAKEFDLLAHLMRSPRVAFTRERLMESVWGWTYGDTATVTVHVRRLRTKIERDPADPDHLVTVPGGYRFDP